MAKNGIIWKGLKKFEKVMNRTSRIVEKHGKKAVGKAGLLMMKEIRKTIRAKVPPPNAPLTVAIKRSRKPLVDHGDLMRSVTMQRINWFSVFVGVLRTDAEFNVAEIVHEGRYIPVTARMRGLFYVLWMASMAKKRGKAASRLTGRAEELFKRFQNWRPLSTSTRVIKIPPRPFIRMTFKSKSVQKQIRQLYWKAASDAIKEAVK